MPSYQPVEALLRGLEVLRVVNRLERASVLEIHRATGLNQPTVVRMLETLIHAGYVVRQAQPALYMPTGRTLELSGGYVGHRALSLAASPVMTALGLRLGWPSDVAVFDGDAMVVAHTSRAEGRFRFERRAGYRAPILATSLGLAFLAFCDAAQRERALVLAARSPESWNAMAHRPEAASARFAEIRARGFAVMDDAYAAREYAGLASSIGVPVLVEGVAVAALNLMYLRQAVSAEEAAARFAPVLREAAARIGARVAGGEGAGDGESRHANFPVGTYK